MPDTNYGEDTVGRTARTVVPGLPHHVTQHGNRNAAVFEDDGDRGVYIAMLRRSASRNGVEIWSYCLMTNHVHFVAVPNSEKGLTGAFHDAHSAYSNWFNRKTGIAGSLWRGRFYSCVMDEPHLWAAVRYVERNPVPAGLVQRAEEYPWSSAPARPGLRTDPLLSGAFPFPGVVADWRAWLADEDVNMSNAIRRNTLLGLPCGSPEFTHELESRFGRLLRHKKAGRPRAK